MFSDLIRVSVTQWPDPKDTWAYVEAGDMITYNEGASYYVEDVVVDDPSQRTFGLRAVVPPEDGMKFWDRCFLSIEKRELIPGGVTVTKG